MREKTYKVLNNNEFPVGLTLINPIREINVRSNSFALLTEDDIAYLHSISKLFYKGILYVEDEEIRTKMGFTENENIINEEQILAILKKNLNVMKKELAKITEPHAKSKIMKVVKKIGEDLSVKKMKFLEEYLGKEIFLDEIN